MMAVMLERNIRQDYNQTATEIFQKRNCSRTAACSWIKMVDGNNDMIQAMNCSQDTNTDNKIALDHTFQKAPLWYHRSERVSQRESLCLSLWPNLRLSDLIFGWVSLSPRLSLSLSLFLALCYSFQNKYKP